MRKPADQSDTIISMQIMDRNGFSETISSKERLSSFQTVNFDTPQPYQKVLRVYGRNLEGQSTSKITSYHDNGYLWQYLDVVDGRAHGFYREWHPNGKLKVEAKVIEGVADINDLAQSSWIFDEMSRVWDNQGSPIAEIPYEKGLLHTPAKYYFSDGSIHKIIPYEKGLIHGVELVYHPNGSLFEEIPYKDDEKHGFAKGFWPDGQLLYEEDYNLGRLINASYYDAKQNCVARIKEGEGKQAMFKEGYLYSTMTYRKGIPEGEKQIFHPNGVLYRSISFKDDKKEGEEWEYYPAQPGDPLTPKLFLHWHDDKIQGQVKTWYPHGQIESQREITSNKKQGLCFAWYTNGDLMLVEEYEYDRLIKGTYYKKGDKKAVSKVEGGKGTAMLYTGNGIFQQKVNYEKGKPQITYDTLQ